MAIIIYGVGIILLPNCTMLYYVFSGPLSLRAYVAEIKCTYIIFVVNCTFVFYVKPAVSYLVLIKIYIPMACFTYRNMDNVECYSVLGLVHSCFR